MNTYGDQYEWFLKLQEERDQKAEAQDRESTLLPALASKPEIFPDLMLYWNAFQELTTSRDTGFGVGYIKYSEITNYLTEELIFEYSERREWIHWIQTIDRLWVKMQSEKQKKEQDRKNKGKGSKPPVRASRSGSRGRRK